MKQDFSESGKCRLSTSKEEFFKTNVAFVAAKSSPLATIFNRKYGKRIFLYKLICIPLLRSYI